MPKKTRTFRVALVGAGYVSSHHLRALRTLDCVEVVAIADLDLSRAKAVANQFEIPNAFASPSDIWSLEPDVTHVLTPPNSHFSVTLAALQAKCHVLVEKPMAETEDQCLQMMEAAFKANRILSVNHSGRMDPVVLKAAQLVHKGVCGEVMGVDYFRSSDYPPYRGGPSVPPPYRTGAYPFEDLGVHGISIIETFLGPACGADVRFWHRGSDINLAFDEWRALVECERGTGQIYLSWNSSPIRSEVFIHGTAASIHLDCFLQTCNVVSRLPGPKFLSNVVSGIRNSALDLWRIPWNVARFATGRLPAAPGIHTSIRRFYESLRDERPVPISAEEGRRIVRVMAPAVNRSNEVSAAQRRERLKPREPAPILVTGAAGFLGRKLVKKLVNEGKRIRVLVRHTLPEWNGDPRIDLMEGDLGDPQVVDQAVRGVEFVFHLGAAMKGRSADFERGTIWGTRNIVDACVRHGVERLVYVSSLTVLDHAGHDHCAPINEAYALEPHPELRGFYTQTKLEAEQVVRTAVDQHQLPAVILRPGQIFGPGVEHVAPPGVVGVGRHWFVVGNGSRRLPLVYVDDVVDALIQAANTDRCGLYNIVDKAEVDQRAYLAAVRHRINGTISTHYVPEWVMLSAGWLCELAQRITKHGMPLSRYRVRSIHPLHPVDTNAAAEELGWTPHIGAVAALKAMMTGYDPSEPQHQEQPRESISVS
jgi:predicted dehydrogenase/nucleoside-diphosphate-sugar epimerase